MLHKDSESKTLSLLCMVRGFFCLFILTFWLDKSKRNEKLLFAHFWSNRTSAKYKNKVMDCVWHSFWSRLEKLLNSENFMIKFVWWIWIAKKLVLWSNYGDFEYRREKTKMLCTLLKNKVHLSLWWWWWQVLRITIQKNIENKAMIK